MVRIFFRGSGKKSNDSGVEEIVSRQQCTLSRTGKRLVLLER
jgi:hypothetical protein